MTLKIDKKFAEFLSNNFSNITNPLVNFSIIKDKLFFNIDYNGNYFYQIMNLKSDNALNFEYLIQVKKINITLDIGSLNNYILNLLLKRGIPDIYSQENPILSEDSNINLYFYSKNSDFQKSINHQNSLSNYQKIYKFNFKTTKDRRTDIVFEDEKNDKTCEELIKKYLKTIKHLELFGKENKDIAFLYNAKAIHYDDLIRDIFKYESTNIILVLDPKGKI